MPRLCPHAPPPTHPDPISARGSQFLPGKYFISAANGIMIEVVCLVLLALQYATERVYLGEEFWRGRKALVRPIWLKATIGECGLSCGELGTASRG
jgi:hypothetical protein